MQNYKTAGFTLVELMIVIAILGLLAAALLPNIMGANDEAAAAETEAIFVQLDSACSSFERSHGVYPPADMTFPEKGHELEKAAAGWKRDNGRNTGIESLVAFVSHSRRGGTDLGGLDKSIVNTDEDQHGAEHRLLGGRSDRIEIADAWGTPIAYFTKFTMKQSQAIVGIDGQSQDVQAARTAGGDFVGARKYQFVSAGKDRTFGTDDDIVWPRN